MSQDAAVEEFNRFVREQQQAEGLAKLTLVLVDDECLVPTQSLPVAEITSRSTEGMADQSLPKNLSIPTTPATIPGSAVPTAMSRMAFRSN